MARRKRPSSSAVRRAQARRVNRRIATTRSNRRRSAQAKSVNRSISLRRSASRRRSQARRVNTSIRRSQTRTNRRARRAAARDNRRRATQARKTNQRIARSSRRTAQRENRARGKAAQRANRQIAKAERRRRKRDSSRENVDDPNALTLVEIAAVNEFGSEDGRVPERSFMRSSFDENRRKYEKALTRALGRVIDGKTTIEHELDLLGARVATDIKRKINTIREPPNAAMTIARKGSSKPLRDTGRLFNSVDHEVRSDE